MTTDQALGEPLQSSVRDRAQRLLQRFTDGRLGVLPTLLALVLIAIFFQSQQPAFLSAGNIANLLLQIVALGCLTVGVVFVLLVAEIDLSVGAVSGLAATVSAVTAMTMGVNQVLAVLLGVLTGVVIGIVQALLVAAFGAPAFIITVAGSIAWQGLQFLLLSGASTVNLQPGFMTQLTVGVIPAPVVGVVGAVLVIGYAVVSLLGYRRTRAHGGAPRHLGWVLARIALAAVLLVALLFIFGRYQGVPYGIVIFVGLVLIAETIIWRTAFGRHVLAVGGNVEAARRAGLPVRRIKVIVFALGSACAAIGGILAASRLGAVNTLSGSGDLMLNAVAAAVIGGTSLFGGRGSPVMAVVGVLVIGTLSNGIDLLGLGTPIKLLITGAVLALSIGFDALTRRSRARHGVG